MDEIELLRGFRRDLSDADPDEVETARAELMRAIDREGSLPSASAKRSRVLSLRRPGLAAVGAAAAAVAAAGVLLVALSSGPGGTPTAAARVLRHAALVAATRPNEAPPRVGQYVYTKSKGAALSLHPVAGGLGGVLSPAVRQSWIGPDGSGRTREVRLPARSIAPPHRVVGSRPGDRILDHSYGPGQLSYLDLSHLPTDPDALRRLIEERKVEGGPPGDVETFAIISDVLRQSYAPPKLRAALYEIASGLSGVELLGKVRDPAGRQGVVVAYVQNGVRNELIFNPKTSILLGERNVLVDPGTAELRAPPGTVVGYSTYLASGIVNSTSARVHGLNG
jgi:hypothetical protein